MNAGVNKFGKVKAYTTPCRLCQTLTPNLGNKLCDGCWELERRIERQPELARRILERCERERGINVPVAAKHLAPDTPLVGSFGRILQAVGAGTVLGIGATLVWMPGVNVAPRVGAALVGVALWMLGGELKGDL